MPSNIWADSGTYTLVPSLDQIIVIDSSYCSSDMLGNSHWSVEHHCAVSKENTIPLSDQRQEFRQDTRQKLDKKPVKNQDKRISGPHQLHSVPSNSFHLDCDYYFLKSVGSLFLIPL